ncbi:hypothetical protein CK203_039384 [Vitis vinifera]|uniref:Retrotransposon gag domain-containing protein n=1 Tax=Vitis vinifera TaxID=29760 RepID=A0A438I7E3_VITVI|nr:hypothetical protein CK203_039384 [Vitis vinifera]
MKRILVGLDIPEERREEFERIFLGKYFGEVAKHAKRMEFEHFIQGTMSVLELVPLAIKDYSELVKRALLVEQNIKETNQIREQRGDRKGKQRMGKSSHGRSQGPQQSGRPLMEGLPIVGCTANSTSISGRFLAAAGSAFPVPSVLVALLLDATFIPNSTGSQNSYHE